jgi:hypothetical protein
LKTFTAELHVHTVLSPCAGVEMIPPLIVRKAIERGINLIAITDHNASENIQSVMKAARDTDLSVLPGMELQTEEEIHILCLFDTLNQIKVLQDVVDKNLPNIKNNIDYFGEQFIVDETGDFIRRKDVLLINSTHLSYEEAYKLVTDLGGLFIPAHVDRQAFGLICRFGFVPPDPKPDAFEISRHISYEDAIQKYPQLASSPLIQSGDVHFLQDFLGVNRFRIEEPTIEEIRMALKAENGRHFELLNRN